MSQEAFIQIAAKHFGHCSSSTDLLLLTHRHLEIEAFLNEINPLLGTSVTEEELMELQYLYNEYPFSKLYEYFIDKGKEQKDNNEAEIIHQQEQTSSEFSLLMNELDEYKEQRNLLLTNDSLKNGCDIELIQQQILEAIEAAKDAVKESEETKKIKVSIFKGSRDAIEGLQSAVAKLAKSGEMQVSALTAQLIYMQRLSIVSKKILELGLLGIHATRTVIAKLDEKLKDPNANLSEIEKQEFNRLLIQLKQNEDFSSRLDKQKEGLINHDRVLIDHGQKIESLIARVEKLENNAKSINEES